MLGAAAILAGLYAALNVRRRVSLLSQCVSLVQFYSVGIGYGDESVELLTQRAAESSEMKDLTFLSKAAKGSSDFSQRWASCIDDGQAALNKGDKELLKAFGAKLGTTDARRQLELCEMYRQRFEQLHTAAKEKQTERSRLFSIGGVALGALLVVILI